MLKARRYTLFYTEILESVELDAPERLIFLVLASHYNRSSGQCNPSLARLVRLSGLSRRTVIRRLETLEEKGLIRREHRTDAAGRRASNGYALAGYEAGAMLNARRFTVYDTEILESAELDPQEKLLFVVLASHFNHGSGRCDPSLARLVRLSGLSRQTVIRRLETLEEKGLIRREHRTDAAGRRASNGYALAGYEADGAKARCHPGTQTIELQNITNPNQNRNRNRNKKSPDGTMLAPSGAKIAPIYPTAEEAPLLVELPEEWRVAQ